MGSAFVCTFYFVDKTPGRDEPVTIKFAGNKIISVVEMELEDLCGGILHISSIWREAGMASFWVVLKPGKIYSLKNPEHVRVLSELGQSNLREFDDISIALTYAKLNYG